MFKIYFTLLLLVPSLLIAGIFPKAGTTAAPFLKIGVGARAVALGENFVALANDASALYWNPAGITQLDKISFSATHTNWFAGITHGAVTLAVPFNDESAIGLEVTYLTSGDIEQTTLQEQEGNGIFYDATDFSMGLTYARMLTDKFSVAVKGKYIQQSIFNEEASTFAFDFGTLYKTDFKGMTIGMNMTNFGGNMQMDGNDLSVTREDPLTGQIVETVLKTGQWPLPILFRVGVAVNIMDNMEGFVTNSENRITLAIDGTHPNDNNETLGLGLEYEWNELLALRTGYKNNHDVQDFSFGGGLKLRMAGVKVSIDYAYADYNDLDSVQRFTANFAF